MPSESDIELDDEVPPEPSPPGVLNTIIDEIVAKKIKKLDDALAKTEAALFQFEERIKTFSIEKGEEITEADVQIASRRLRERARGPNSSVLTASDGVIFLGEIEMSADVSKNYRVLFDDEHKFYNKPTTVLLNGIKIYEIRGLISGRVRLNGKSISEFLASEGDRFIKFPKMILLEDDTLDIDPYIETRLHRHWENIKGLGYMRFGVVGMKIYLDR